MTTKDLATQLLESQAREAVLREALKEIKPIANKMWRLYGAVGGNVVNIIEQALAQTIPDGFGQRVSEASLAAVDWRVQESKNEHYGRTSKLIDMVDALTLEDMALLEAMKGGV